MNFQKKLILKSGDEFRRENISHVDAQTRLSPVAVGLCIDKFQLLIIKGPPATVIQKSFHIYIKSDDSPTALIEQMCDLNFVVICRFEFEFVVQSDDLCVT